MNERIQEMAEQAFAYAEYYAMLTESKEKEIFSVKLTELIVRECIQFVGDADSLKVKQMKEHFGVE